MTIHVEIPEPLAAQVTDAARSRATSPERYVLDALSQTVAADTQLPPPQLNGTDRDVVLGVLPFTGQLSAAVPEPATWMLLIFVAAGWCLRRGRAV